MKACKKLFSLMLVAILLVSAVPFQALATELEETPVVEETPEVYAPGDIYVTLTADGYADNGQLVEATVNGGESWSITVKTGESIGVLPDAVPANSTDYAFAGWYTDAGVKVNSNSAYDDSYTALTAKFTATKASLQIKTIVNGATAAGNTILTYNLAPSTKLLDFLNGTAKADVAAVLSGAEYAGYTWDHEYWYDYSGKIPLTQQDQYLNEHQIVCIKLIPNTYRLDFNAGDGKVDPANKEVVYKQKVGTLPTPTLKDYLFRGWFTAEGKQYTADTVYNVAGNTILYANWKEQETVILEIYLNGNTKKADRCPVLTGYAAGEYITQATVEALVKQYYSAASGSSLTLQGLYDENTWQNYLANSSEAGSASVQVKEEGITRVYVMVNNAKQGATPTTNNNTAKPTTKPADTTNPATGDTSMIYTAMVVMVLAAAAMVVMMQLRKKEQF